MEDAVRVRLVFDGRHVLSKSLRSLKRSWLLLRPGLVTVSDVASHIADSFELHSSCPNGLILSMDDFVLPPFESTGIFKDKDVVWVKKKGSKLKEINRVMDEANHIEGTYRKEKQPLLLANKEFEKESGGYRSEEEDEGIEEPKKLKYSKGTTCETSTQSPQKKRKRSCDIRSPKRKKNKVSSPEELTVAPTGNTEVVQKKQASCQQDTSKRVAGSSNAYETTSGSHDSELSKDKDASIKVGQDLVENGEGNTRELAANGGTKKIPSRSSRRKKAKRIWLRNQANSDKKDLGQNHVPESNDDKQSKEDKTVVANVNGGEMVPIVVRPGHIRFEPLDDESDIPHRPDQEILRWNGTTDKKKGQKWGRENNFAIEMNNQSKVHQQSDDKNKKETSVPESVEPKKLVPLTRPPKVGEVVAYQMVELSSSWCPVISSVRLGKVKSFDPNTMNAVLEPVPGHPIMASADKTDEESTDQPLPSLYKEDGSLEIDFSSLIDVRVYIDDKVTDTITSNGKEEPSNEENLVATPGTSADSTSDDSKDVAASPSSGNKKNDAWEEVNQALQKKKAELLHKDGWSNWSTPNKHSSNPSLTFKAIRRSALGPTISLLRASKDL